MEYGWIAVTTQTGKGKTGRARPRIAKAVIMDLLCMDTNITNQGDVDKATVV